MRLEVPIPGDILAAIQAPFRDTPAEILDAPLLQPLGLLLDLAGETLRERLFAVQGDGPETCLRPDFTVPAVRAYIASGRPAGRYFYSGHAFLVATRGSQKAEEFPQVGVEAFEPGDPAAADAEMAALAWRASVAGGRDDLTLLMGDIGLFGAFIDALEVTPPLAARLKRVFPTPWRLRLELDGGNCSERPGRRGSPAAGSRRCSRAFPNRRRRVCSKRSGRSPASSRWAADRRPRSCTGWPSVRRWQPRRG